MTPPPHPPHTLGWVYNLDHVPETSDAGQIITIAVVFPVIAVLISGLRLATRMAASRVGWDDIFITLSALLGIGYSATSIYQTRWGLGLQTRDFPPENLVRFSRVQYCGGPQYCLAVLGFKLSLLFSYLRVAGFNRAYAVTINVVIVAVIISQVIFAILLSAACHPISKQWNPALPGECIDTLATYFALGGTSLTWDLIIIVLPLPIVRRLQLDRQNKMALGVVYGLGFFVTVVQAIRMRTVAKLANYVESEAIIEWSIVEMNLGVIVACVPALAPLLRHCSKQVVQTSRSKLASISPSKFGSGHGSEHISEVATKVGTQSRASRKMADTEGFELYSWNGERHVWHDANARPGSDRKLLSTLTRSRGDRDDELDGINDVEKKQQQQQNDRIHVRLEVTVQQREDGKGGM
ncbi:hypothetical protein AAFC00_000736 [Neodothiora populina]|uniref:Rhodopsin domain-containing protein n=1 Tax=Neodothiora populina TaxID=2781224 RepID=A0ABR3PDU4_9PEZI